MDNTIYIENLFFYLLYHLFSKYLFIHVVGGAIPRIKLK